MLYRAEFIRQPKQSKYFTFCSCFWWIMICTGDGCLEILISLDFFFHIHFRYVSNIFRPKHLVLRLFVWNSVVMAQICRSMLGNLLCMAILFFIATMCTVGMQNYKVLLLFILALTRRNYKRKEFCLIQNCSEQSVTIPSAALNVVSKVWRNHIAIYSVYNKHILVFQ
jgi:hypothetical protein